MRLVNFLGLASTLFAVACGESVAPGPGAQPPRTIAAVTIARASVRETGEYLGTLSSRQRVSVEPQVTGYVRRIHVRPGQRLAEGDLLVEIDGRQQTAALQNAEARERAALTNLGLARQTLERTRSLHAEGLVSAQELERAQAALETAEAAGHSAAAQISQRRVQLQYFAVRSPIAGTAGDVLVRLGDYVHPSAVITSVSASESLEVGVFLPAVRARSLTERSLIEILDDAGEVLVQSKIQFVAPEADPRTQLVEVKAEFQNAARLRPNELVRTRLVFGEKEAVVLPALAVVRQSGQTFAFVVVEDEGRLSVSRRPVRLGALGDREYVVEGGLEVGDRIAVSALQMLREGSAVVLESLDGSPVRSPETKTAP